MQFSIITPSFRSSTWLKLCLASVADQGVQLEHIVQDAVSDDGTLDWLPHDPRVRAFVEKDRGMYDAINRGLARATGQILAYLNCDEQYLPGTLPSVAQFFEQNPEIDVLFGNVVMIDPAGNYLFHRKLEPPLKYHTWTCHLSTLSCAMFFRRRVVFDYGFNFNPAFRAAGDGEWMLRLLQKRVPMAALGRFTSAFTQTGANIGANANARRENHELFLSAPRWARTCKPLFIAHHRFRRLLGGSYSQSPFRYEIYTAQSPQKRVTHEVTRPRFRSA